MLFNYNYHHRVIISVLFFCVCFFFLIQKQLFVLENTMPMIPGHSWHFLLNDWHIYISRSNSNRMVGFQGSSLGGWPGCFSKPVSLINTGSRSSGHVEASLSHVYRTTDPRSPTCSSWHCGVTGFWHMSPTVVDNSNLSEHTSRCAMVFCRYKHLFFLKLFEMISRLIN